MTRGRPVATVTLQALDAPRPDGNFFTACGAIGAPAPGPPMQRFLTSILFLDVRNSTGLIASDEVAGAETISNVMGRIKPLLGAHGGTLFHSAGDGVGVFFGNTLDACKAGLAAIEEVQRASGAALAVRVGIHNGEVLEIDALHYGAAINFASHLEGVAPPNAVVASDAVLDALKSAEEIAFEPLGRRRLKNIPEPVHVHRVRWRGRPQADPAAPAASPTAPGYELAHGPVIAVVPFDCTAEEPAWRTFASGCVEDIAGALSRFRVLTVISPRSSRIASELDLAPGELGERLGARYLLYGTIRVLGERLRVATALVDAESGSEIWAERFDRGTGALFDVQDEIALQLGAILSAQIEHVERQRIVLTRPDSLQAYELMLTGLHHIYRHTRRDNQRARGAFRRALKADPRYARACAGLSKTYNLDWRYNWTKDRTRALDLALELARTATDLDDFDSRGHSELGFSHLYRCEHAESLRAYERALELNPCDADVMVEYADALVYVGRPQEACERIVAAKRLNPFHPDWYLWAEAGALYQSRRYEDAVTRIAEMKDSSEASRLLAACHARLGDTDRAAHYREAALRRAPNFRLAEWGGGVPFREAADMEHYVGGLSLAGFR